MIYLYRLALPLATIASLPYYLYRMFRRGGYSHKIMHRLGFWPDLKPRKKGVLRIWIQAVSVGELSSISKLLENLLRSPNLEIILSNTTSTGLKLGDQQFGSRLLAHGPFPLDWLPFSNKAWNKINPDLAILVDSELWPEHFHQAKKREVPVMIINARLSDRTFARLSSPLLRWAYPLIFPDNLSIIASSENQYSRWASFPLPPEKIKISGNLKIDAVNQTLINPQNRIQIRKDLGFTENTLVLAGVSTWEGEEKMLVDLVQLLRLEKIDCRLLLIPRHAERRHEIKKVLQSSAIPHHFRTDSQRASNGTIAYVGDTTGEVIMLLQAADFAFMGKSLPPHHGGQNPIEPVAIGLPLVVGPNYQNFRETCRDLLKHEGILIGKNIDETKSNLWKIAMDQELREQMHHNCNAWMTKQGHPSQYTYEAISKEFEKISLEKSA